MAGYDGSIRINTQLNTRGFERDSRGLISGMQRLGSSLNGIISSLGFAFGIAGLVALGKQAIETASDFEAMESQFSQVFGELESVASKSLSEVAKQAGIMEERMKPSFTKIAAFAKTTGMDTASSLKLSERAMMAVADSAAFYDRSLEETTEYLQSFLKGNYENDSALGLSATEFTRNAAANKLYGKSFIELSEAQKQLTLLQMVEDANRLSGAIGQAAREADTWTNQVGNLNQAWVNLKATLGKFILPIAIQAVKAITNVINAINAMLTRLYAAVGIFKELITGKKVSTEISFETKTGINMGDEYDEAAEGAENLASANDDIAKSAKKAAKAAKGALGPFDELTVLAKQTGSGSADSGAEIGGGFEMPELVVDTEVEEVDTLSSAIDSLLERLKPLFDWFVRLKGLFVEGFFDGLGESWNERISDIQESARNIVKNLVEIFTDPSVATASQTMIEKVVYAMGESLGAVVSIGTTIGQNLIGGIDIYLEENKEFLKEKLVSIFDIAGDIALLIGEAFESIAYIFEAFGSESGQQLTANIIGIFSDTILNLLELAGKFGRDILDCIITPISENKEELRTALEGLLGVAAEVSGTVLDAINHTFEKINEVYDKYFKPFFESIKTGLSELLAKFLEFWNGYMQPILDKWAEMFDTLMKEHIQPMIDNFLDLIGKVVEMLTMMWENTIKPLIAWLIEVLAPTVADVCDIIFGVIDTVITYIADVINGIIEIVEGVIDRLLGIAQGDWQRVWDGFAEVIDGVAGVIKAIINAIIGTVEGVANAVVAAINTMIRAINSISFEVPEFDIFGKKIGGMTIGFSLSEIPKVNIPRLADGAVIRGGDPFMAVLGDQRFGQTNIEAPLATIEKAVTNAMNKNGGMGGEITVKVYLGEKDITQAVKTEADTYFKRTGKSLFAY